MADKKIKRKQVPLKTNTQTAAEAWKEVYEDFKKIPQVKYINDVKNYQLTDGEIGKRVNNLRKKHDKYSPNDNRSDKEITEELKDKVLKRNSNLFNVNAHKKALKTFDKSTLDISGKALAANKKIHEAPRIIKDKAKDIITKDLNPVYQAKQTKEKIARRVQHVKENTVGKLTAIPKTIINTPKNIYKTVKEDITSQVKNVGRTIGNITNKVKRFYNNGKKLVSKASHLANRVYGVGKSVRNRIKSAGGLRQLTKDTATSLNNKRKNFNSGLKSKVTRLRDNPGEVASEAAGNVYNLAKDGLKNAGQYAMDKILDGKEKFLLQLAKVAKIMVAVGKAGAVVVALAFIAEITLFGIFPIIGYYVNNDQPHYYCDTETTPEILRSRSYYKRYCDVGSHVENFVYFQQNEHDWSGNIYQHSVGPCPIGDCGCGPTSFTMAAATFSDNLDYTPDLGAEDYTNKANKTGTIDELNIEVERNVSLDMSSEQYIKDKLDDGCFVQVCMGRVGATNWDDSPANNSSAHYVLITGYDNDGFYIGDPFTPSNTSVDSTPGSRMNDTVGTREEPYSISSILRDLKGSLGGAKTDNIVYCQISKK